MGSPEDANGLGSGRWRWGAWMEELLVALAEAVAVVGDGRWRHGRVAVARMVVE